MAIAAKSFSIDDQQRFARLSGDANPIHLDPLAARRTAAGALVVHGVHALLWMLDALGQAHPEIGRLSRLKVRFRKMIYLDERIETRIMRLTASALHLQAWTEGSELLEIWARPGEPAAAPAPHAAGGEAPPRLTAPRALGEEDMAGRSGRVDFVASPAEMQRLFPGAARLLGARRAAALACASYLVGMVVPGLRSLFVGLDLAAVEEPEEQDLLSYSVSFDARFRRTDIEVQGGGLAGTLAAMVRPAPVEQASMHSVARMVDGAGFTGTTALVVGGSRGLGEIAAKLLAAGGAEVLLTHAAGGADAERLANEIRAAGGRCRALRYDIREDAREQLAALRAAPPTQLYYFASPTIHRRKAAVFSAARFEELNRYFLQGFDAVLQAALELRPAGIRAFYPSSEFVVERPAEMTEYAMSKAAAEVLCADLAAHLPGARVLVRRLPRVLTDQTSMLEPGEAADPLPLMLPIVRAMHD
jgi:NAD(P)-dependent dehydrogenase (short-subunit alcohol dehydrogenase family)